MKTIIPYLTVLVLISGCGTKNEDCNLSTSAENKTAIANTPEINWKVNKTLDENGNVVSYDSVYTRYQSFGSNKLNRMAFDSVFKNHFGATAFGFPPTFKNEFFKKYDSLIRHDLFDQSDINSLIKRSLLKMHQSIIQMDSSLQYKRGKEHHTV